MREATSDESEEEGKKAERWGRNRVGWYCSMEEIKVRVCRGRGNQAGEESRECSFQVQGLGFRKCISASFRRSEKGSMEERRGAAKASR